LFYPQYGGAPPSDHPGAVPQPAGHFAKLAREKSAANLDHGSTNQRSAARLTAYDALLARRTAALGLLLSALVYLAMIGTDDTASTHAGRLGRLSALASLAGAGGAFLALAQARSRGEMRALGLAGLTPARASLGAVIGGAAVGLAGAAMTLAPGVDLTPLFPHALPTEGGWVLDGAAWVDGVHAVRVAADGVVTRVGAPSAVELAESAPPSAATAIALALAALAVPLWAVAWGPPVRRAFVGFAVASAAVFVFHLVAAHRSSAMTLVLPPLLLLVDAWALHRGDAWS
jgi:hypothetical protein